MARKVAFWNAFRLYPFVSAVIVAVATAGAAIVPLSPTDGVSVPLVPDAQKAVMSIVHKQ